MSFQPDQFLQPLSTHQSRNHTTIAIICLLLTSFFSAYKPFEGLLSTLLSEQGQPHLGPLAMFTAYFTFALGSLLQPYLAYHCKLKYLLLSGGLMFCFYTFTGMVLSFQKEIVWWCKGLLILGAVSKGMGNVCLWAGQAGIFKLLIPKGQQSRINTLFWSVMQSCFMTGNLISYFLVKYLSEQVFLVIVVSAVLITSLGMGCIPDPQKPQNNYDINPQGILDQPVMPYKSVQKGVSLIRQKGLMSIILLFFSTGTVVSSTGAFFYIVLAYSMGLDINHLNSNQSHRLNMQVLLTITLYGFLAFSIGLLASRIIKRKFIYVIASSSQSLAVTCYLGALWAAFYRVEQFAIAALAILGVSDTLNNISVNVITQVEFPNRFEPYSVFRLVNPFSTSLLYVLQEVLNRNVWGVGGYLVGQAVLANVGLLMI